MASAAPAPAAAAAPVSVSYAERMGLRRVHDPLNLNSSVALVMDAETHEILLGKNDRAVLPIASLTKLMTGILIADANLPLNEVITITNADVDRLKNSGSRLAVGTRLTRGQALHLSMMSSENRAAHALARTFPGGVDQFVRLMNEKAQSLGMVDTRFADPTGLSPRNQSSARDIAILTAASHQRPILRDLSTSPSYDLAVGGHRLPYRNSNRLVLNEAWDISLQKTGFIREAGRCVTMKFNMEGRDFIMVLLDAANPSARINDAERLRRWMLETNDFGSQQFASAY
jgi:D-alanyl-D-alanine endopeptidase (penicillin-binding protein 7)